MLKIIKKVLGFKVKEDEESPTISSLESARREDHDRILANARRDKEIREKRNRESMRAKDSSSDGYLNPLSPLNPINNTFDDDSTRHRKHDSGSGSFVDSGFTGSHSHSHGGDSGGGGGGDSGGGDGGGD